MPSPGGDPGAIDLDGSHVISPPPVPKTAAPRIAPLRVPIAGVMTKPDRLSTANAIAQAPSFSAAAHPNAKPISRSDHDRIANAIRVLAMDAVEQAKSGHPGLPMGADAGGGARGRDRRGENQYRGRSRHSPGLGRAHQFDRNLYRYDRFRGSAPEKVVAAALSKV
jgi:hypothetical protein